MRKNTGIALVLALACSGPGHATGFEPPELMMRSGAGSAYQIPVGSSWSSKTPSINDNGQVAMSINSVPPEFHAGVWLGTVEGGDIVDIAVGDGDLYSNVSINNHGQIVWTRNESSLDGILMYDPVEDETVHLTNAPLGASGWTAVSINDQEALGYRASFSGGRAWVSWDSDDDDVIHLAETGVDSNSDYAFLFTPSLNNDRLIAGKAAIDSFSTNQIVTVDEQGNIDVLVEDDELDPDSPFSASTTASVSMITARWLLLPSLPPAAADCTWPTAMAGPSTRWWEKTAWTASKHLLPRSTTMAWSPFAVSMTAASGPSGSPMARV